MFFITENGTKDWKKDDTWHKPSKIVEGYDAKNSNKNNSFMIFVSVLSLLAVLCVLYFLYKRKDD